MEDPTQISPRQEKQIKKYVKDYFDKAVIKKREHEKKKAERKAKEGKTEESTPAAEEIDEKKEEEDSDEGEPNAISDDEDQKPEAMSETPLTPLGQTTNGDGLKRKRQLEGFNGVKIEDEDATPSKRVRSTTPPVPPPPSSGLPEDEYDAMDIYGEYSGSTSRSYQDMENGLSPINGVKMELIEQPTPPPPPPITDLMEAPLNGFKAEQYEGSPSSFAPPPTPGDYLDNDLDK